MKDLFFMLLSVYLLTLIFGSIGSFFRFWVDVAKFHPKEEKEPKLTKRQFKKSIKAMAAPSEPVEKEDSDYGRDEHNPSAVL